MKATVGLEYIGAAYDSPTLGISRKPWIAEIIARDSRFGFSRRFLRAKAQLKRANRVGSRGVELWFVLESGRLYEVKSPTSWRSTDRYFCVVSEDGRVQRLSDQEVQRWLSARSASTS